MKHALGALFALSTLALSGCATSSNNRMEVEVVQLVGPQLVQAEGNFDVEYGINVHNPSNEPVTISRVDVRQIGQGPYQIVQDAGSRSFRFSKLVPPGSDESVSIWLHARQDVLPGELQSYEPVNLRTIVYFEAPSGSFRQIVNTIVEQAND